MKNSFLNIYKNKKIIITGHTGFKGAWLSLVLNEFGARVYGISLKPEDVRGNFYNIVRLNKKINGRARLFQEGHRHRGPQTCQTRTWSFLLVSPRRRLPERPRSIA